MLKSGKLFALALILAVAAGCDDDPNSPVVAQLECTQPGGGAQECTLELQHDGGFEVSIESTDCAAHGNTVRLVQPDSSVLTSDGCYETQQRWEFTGPYPAGTAIALEVISGRRASPPALRVEGEYPEWIVEFEDGGDEDFNDLVLAIRATREGSGDATSDAA